MLGVSVSKLMYRHHRVYCTAETLGFGPIDEINFKTNIDETAANSQ